LLRLPYSEERERADAQKIGGEPQKRRPDASAKLGYHGTAFQRRKKKTVGELMRALGGSGALSRQ